MQTSPVKQKSEERERETRPADARGNIYFPANYVRETEQIHVHTRSQNCCTVRRKRPPAPCRILFLVRTLSARDARGVYVCLASMYPVIRDRFPCPSRTVGPTPRFERREPDRASPLPNRRAVRSPFAPSFYPSLPPAVSSHA